MADGTDGARRVVDSDAEAVFEGDRAAHGVDGVLLRHPGAGIGGRFFIDRGTGVAIGATAAIGERVRLFQAATLGAESFPADENGQVRKGLPRPAMRDDVVRSLPSAPRSAQA